MEIRLQATFVDPANLELITRLTEDPDFDWPVELAVADTSAGAFTVVGSPEDVADALDQIEHRYDAGVAEYRINH
jgi:alkanesulfonate monooxygenase SsuD/methylene tetrahydromethanopterin reductase-like flavin-dependent oxidoreductase (luciferase family)